MPAEGLLAGAAGEEEEEAAAGAVGLEASGGGVGAFVAGAAGETTVSAGLADTTMAGTGLQPGTERVRRGKRRSTGNLMEYYRVFQTISGSGVKAASVKNQS